MLHGDENGIGFLALISTGTTLQSFSPSVNTGSAKGVSQT
jgi:hypothetical protein